MPVRAHFQLTVDCADPAVLVPFWADALGYAVQPPPRGHASWNAYYRSVGVPAEELPQGQDAVDSIVDPDGAGPPPTPRATSSASSDRRGGHRSAQAA